jgi:outer membrane protein assembly factor BamB
MNLWISSVTIAAIVCECFGFRGGPSHLGTYDSPAPTLKAVKWRFATKGRIISSPLVVGGTVYVGSGDGNLYAVNASDGSKAWAFETRGPVTSSPAYADGIVYVASLDGSVYAVDARSGARRWRFSTQGERRFTAPGIHGIQPATELMPDPYDLFISSPTVYGGLVYVGSGDHNVYALDTKTGALRWKFATGNVVHASPAVVDGLVYVGSWDRYFYALDARTGKLRWRFLTGNDTRIYNQVGINSSAAVSGDSVYFGCRDSHLYALDRRSGTVRWTHDEHGSWVISSPAVSGDTVFYTTSDEEKFFALDARTGAERFRVSERTFSFSSPAIAGGRAYFGTFDGRLYAVDASSGAILATFSTDASARNAPAHLDSGGNLRLRDFYPDDTLDGTVVGLSRILDLGSIVSSPAIAGGVLFVGGADGTLYAVS